VEQLRDPEGIVDHRAERIGMNLKPIRRKLHARVRKVGLRRLAAYLDPGPLVRLWDKDFNLIADSDRGDRIPSFESIDYEVVRRAEYMPATSVRVR